MERDPYAGGRQQRQVVGTVTDGDCFRRIDAEFDRESQQGFPLGLSGDDRLLHSTYDPIIHQVESIGDDVVETECRPNSFGKDCKPARHQRRRGARAPHRGDERPGAWRQPNPLSHFLKHLDPRTLKQRDASFERSDKIDFPVHRALGDFSNWQPNPKAFGEFIEHLVLDDRRFQIGDEEPFASPRIRLNEHIDAGITDEGACRRLDMLGAGRPQHKIAGLARRQPAWLGPDSEGHRNCRSEVRQIRTAAGPSDQGQDHPHDRASYSRQRPHHKSARASSDTVSVLVIAGPTASGKSALALELADAFGGTVINADSQQIYRDLRVLTARPDAAAEQRVPHRLYGVLDAAERGSVADWRALALDEVAAATGAGRLPIVVGGTGLYIRALENGLAPVPEIPEAVRHEARELHRELGGVAFREKLARLDPAGAKRLFPGDRQRLVRAYEVVRATGIPLSDWQRRPYPSSPHRFFTILFMPPRETLYANCDARFVRMIEEDALGEVGALDRRGLDPDLPAMKAVGVPEILRYLRGEMPLEAAITAGQQATRRYAKRQMTWFRHQTAPDVTFTEQFSLDLLPSSLRFVRDSVLTA
jgi:tRNA dimethylallyltransferase